jgi:predicted AlkP superfamily pyrophosphatase or phosphodiesterase
LLSALSAGCPAGPEQPPAVTPAPTTPPPPPASSPPPSAARPSPKPRLVVLLVVDQMPSWTFSRQASAFRGGFARLIKEGVFWPRGAYPYAATITAIGHTALATGAEPHRSGVIGNTWWDRAAGRWVDSTEDPSCPSLPTHPNDDGASPHHRLVEAVGLGRRVLSVSYKERSAVLMAPSKGAVVAWYEPEQRAFVSSTSYGVSRPAWLDALAREHPIAPRLDYVWTPLEETPKRALVPDASPGEVGKFGLKTTFPHRLGDSTKPAYAVGATPLGTDLLLEATLAGLAAVEPELLDVSFSAHDLAGHGWGQESWEATDVLFRMDDAIGKLLAALDERYGKDGWSLVFSSDHGAAAIPERTPGNVRVDLSDVEKAAAAGAGGAKWIGALDEKMIWLSPAARALPADAQAKMVDKIAAAVKKLPGIGFAIPTEPFRTNADCTGLPELEGFVCRAYHPERSGDVYYGPRERSYVMKRPFEADFHGTPYAYDREVPIIVREPGREPRVLDQESPSTLRVAPTIARLLGVPPPPAAREAPL